MATPTFSEIETALNEYSDFEEVASVARAKLYITAAKRWLLIVAGSASNESSSMSRNVPQIESMMKRAMDYVAINDSSNAGRPGSTRFLGVGGSFR